MERGYLTGYTYFMEEEAPPENVSVAPSASVPESERVTYFATTDSRNKRTPFGIKTKDRSKHLYVIGKTGMGKSTLLENMAVQDMKSGQGLAFLDPHGATAEKLLNYVPRERIDDVVYFAPFDMEYPIAFNVMEDVGPDKRHLVVNGLMSTFEKIWVDAWSARMAYILQNTLLALLEFPNSTLLGVNRMLSDKEYRKAVVANVADPSVRSFWVDEFAKYTERFAAEATPAIQNKVGQFTSNPLIRNIIGQPKSSFDFRDLIDKQKIIIVNLSKGKVGEGNANLLGSMLITRIYLAAMSRADSSSSELNRLPNFYLYVDEFQSFANKSFENILSEARKYKLNLTIAHQYIEQMEEEVQAAVFGNVGTTVAFRVGPLDAELLEKIFMPQFTEQDLVNLGFAQIYLTLMIDGVGSPPFSATTLPPIASPEVSYRDQIIERSRQVFGRPRAVVEDEIKKWHEPATPPPVSETSRPRPERPPLPRQEQTRRSLPPSQSTERPFQPQKSASQVLPPKQPQPSEVQTALRASLAEVLKKRAPDKPKESPENHRAQLHSALAAVLKQNAGEKTSPPSVSSAPAVKSPESAPAPLSVPPQTEMPLPPLAAFSPPKQGKKEVPEEVLRKLLNDKPQG